MNDLSVNYSRKTDWFFEIVLIIYMLHDIPIIGYLTPAVVYAGAMILLFVLTYNYVGKNQFWRYFGRTIPLSFIIFLNIFISFFSTNGGIAVQIYRYLQIVVYLIIGQYIINSNDGKLAKHLYYVLLIMYIVTAITSYLGFQVYPLAARDLATTLSEEESVLYDVYCRMNIGGFTFIYTLVLVIPLIVGGIKYKIGNSFYLVLITVLFFLVVIKSQYTTALLLVLLSLVLLFVNKKFDKRKTYGLFILVLFVLVFASSILPPILSSISRSVESEVLSERLDDLSIGLSGEKQMGNIGVGSDVDARFELLMKSIKVFLNTYTLGAWGSQALGGHSFVLDNMANFGIIGLIAIIIIWVKMYSLYLKHFDKKNYFGYYMFAFFEAMILSVLNPQIFYTVLGFIMPIVIVVFDNEIIRRNRF